MSPRELEVLRVAGPDLPVAAVARRLHLSGGTVRNHLASVTAELGAASRAEAHHRAVEHGWLT